MNPHHRNSLILAAWMSACVPSAPSIKTDEPVAACRARSPDRAVFGHSNPAGSGDPALQPGGSRSGTTRGEPTGAWPGEPSDPGGDEGSVLYRLLGRLLSGALVVDEQAIRGPVLDALPRWDAGRVGPCPAARCGQAEAPAGAPLEMAFWLAVVDLASDRGTHRVGTSYQNSMLHGESRLVSVTRDTFEFTPAPGIACESQVRLYRLSERAGANPAEDAVEQMARSDPGEQSDRERLDRVGLLDQGRGQVFMELREEAPGYVLEIHLGFDTDLLHGAGETIDRALRCRADRQLISTTIPELGYRLQPGSNGGSAVLVFRVTGSRDEVTP